MDKFIIGTNQVFTYKGFQEEFGLTYDDLFFKTSPESIHSTGHRLDGTIVIYADLRFIKDIGELVQMLETNITNNQQDGKKYVVLQHINYQLHEKMFCIFPEDELLKFSKNTNILT